MIAAVHEALKAAPAVWFRSRAYHEYGTVAQWVRGQVNMDTAKILDFGCGSLPVAAASFALRHPDAEVIGCDILPARREALVAALSEHAQLGMPENLRLEQMAPNTIPESCVDLDLVYSWSVFEHVPAGDVTRNFELVRDSLGPDGIFFFQNGGLYFNTEGSHLKHLLPGERWHHLTNSISELHAKVMAADAPQRAKEGNWIQFTELNRLTADDFMDAASDAGLELMLEARLRDTGGPPPASLLRVYSEDVLMTTEVRALFRARA